MRRALGLVLIVAIAAAVVFLRLSSAPVLAEPSASPDFPIRNPIDGFVLQRLRAEKIAPSGLCTDGEFARRVYVDICGVVPTAQQVKQFAADKREDKRAKLIDALLQSPRYAEHWQVLWSDLLRDNSNSPAYHAWMRQALARNMPYDEFTRRLIAASGNTDDNPATVFYLRDQGNHVEQVNTVSTVFMGTRMACAQCHDHPFDKWTQDDFHGLMAFFVRTAVEDDPVARLLKVEARPDLAEAPREALAQYFVEAHKGELRSQVLNAKHPNQRLPIMGAMQDQPVMPRRDIVREIEASGSTKNTVDAVRRAFDQSQTRIIVERTQGEYRLPNEGDGISKKRKGDEVIAPVFAWDPSRRWDGQGSRRVPLAEFVTGSRQFAAVQVNRMWAQLMGRGIVMPVDDFREKNPPTHPELLEYLTDEFIRSKFDNQHILKLILNSNTYQLSAQTTDANRGDSTLYSHHRVRRMSAEEAFDSILVATGHDNHVDDANGYLKDEKPEDGSSLMLRRAAKPDAKKNGALQFAAEVRVPAQTGSFFNLFNQPDREQTATWREEASSIPQALELMNGHTINDAIRNSPLARTLVSVDLNPKQIASELFLSTIGREPSAAELEMLFKVAPAGSDAGKMRAWIDDVYWALLNSPEFTYVR